MGLHWDLSGIDGFEELCFDETTERPEGFSGFGSDWTYREESGTYRRLSPVTYVLIWTAMGIGMREITSDNVAEWIYRKRIQEVGTPGSDIICADSEGNSQERNITDHEIRQHIGLSTNVSNLSFTKWINSQKRAAIQRLSEEAQEVQS